MTKAEKRKRARAKQQKRRRNEHRKLLREARAITGMTAEQLELGHINPVDAIQQVLDRTYAQLVVASSEVDNLTASEMWRDTMVGKLPNEWIRLEQELRNQVSNVAARMLHLDIEGRKAVASEMMAAALVPVLGGIVKDLRLTRAQMERAPEVVGKHLKLLEPAA